MRAAGMRSNSGVPLNTASSASSDNSATGVSSVNPYSSSTVSISQKIRVFVYLPSGTSAPFLMLSFGSGHTFSRSITLTTPSPLHLGQAPCEELNEKLCGAGSR